MVPSRTPLQIVRSWPGDGTGDMRVMDQNGNTWDVVRDIGPIGTGDRWGYTDYRNIYEK